MVSNVSAVAYVFTFSNRSTYNCRGAITPTSWNQSKDHRCCLRWLRIGGHTDGRDTSGKQRSVSGGRSGGSIFCRKMRRGPLSISAWPRPSARPLALALAPWFILAVDGLRIVWVRSSKHHSLPSLSHGVAEPISNMLQVKC